MLENSPKNVQIMSRYQDFLLAQKLLNVAVNFDARKVTKNVQMLTKFLKTAMFGHLADSFSSVVTLTFVLTSGFYPGL